MNGPDPIAVPLPPTTYNEDTVPPPEYRVRTVARHVVTRYCHPVVSKDGRIGNGGGSSVVGEFQSEQQAFEVAQALAAREPGGGTVSV
jgi:hypothetical protein